MSQINNHKIENFSEHDNVWQIICCSVLQALSVLNILHKKRRISDSPNMLKSCFIFITATQDGVASTTVNKKVTKKRNIAIKLNEKSSRTEGQAVHQVLSQNTMENNDKIPTQYISNKTLSQEYIKCTYNQNLKYWKCTNFCDNMTQQFAKTWQCGQLEILTSLELIFYQSARRDHRTQNIIMIKKDTLKWLLHSKIQLWMEYVIGACGFFVCSVKE